MGRDSSETIPPTLPQLRASGTKISLFDNLFRGAGALTRPPRCGDVGPDVALGLHAGLRTRELNEAGAVLRAWIGGGLGSLRLRLGFLRQIVGRGQTRHQQREQEDEPSHPLF